MASLSITNRICSEQEWERVIKDPNLLNIESATPIELKEVLNTYISGNTTIYIKKLLEEERSICRHPLISCYRIVYNEEDQDMMGIIVDELFNRRSFCNTIQGEIS
ncbi:MAG: hypothetical protein GY804_08700 [Alphaproteobacteria bacterium]|nr:hypothetical protein [Alphaproteobacteria bacterium]